MNKGVVYALSAYLFWGLHPVYWKLLRSVPAYEIVMHRIMWSLVFFAIIITIRRDWKQFFSKLRSSTNRKTLIITAFLISSNWGLYIWAVNAGFIVETSLGYFISPLISVILGVMFFKEKLRRVQWTAVALAASGVIYMTFIYGQFPWISLYLAGTWGLYGMLRKKVNFGHKVKLS